MDISKDVWMGEVQKEVAARIQKLDKDGRLTGNVTTYSLDGAIALTDRFAILNGNVAAVDMTLATGATGQGICIKAINVTGGVTVTPASFVDGTTITFSSANEYVELISDGTYWYFVGGDATIS